MTTELPTDAITKAIDHTNWSHNDEPYDQLQALLDALKEKDAEIARLNTEIDNMVNITEQMLGVSHD